MKMRTLIAVAVAGAFAVPLAAQASVDNDRIILAQAGGSSGSAPGGASSSGAPSAPSTGAAAQSGAGAGSSTGQAAQSGQPGTGPTLAPTDMQQLDANNDGYLSREEAMKHQSMGTRFSELDKDSDGRISREEWNAGVGSAATGATTGAGSTSPAQSTGTAGSRPQK